MVTWTPSSSAQICALPVTEFALFSTATEGVRPGGQGLAHAVVRLQANAKAATTFILFISVSFISFWVLLAQIRQPESHGGPLWTMHGQSILRHSPTA